MGQRIARASMPPRKAPAQSPSKMPARWLVRLAGVDDGADFGIYRRLRALRHELEQLLTSELPQTVESSLASADRRGVYRAIDRVIRIWQARGVDCSPARQLPAASDEWPLPVIQRHFHATSPLPCYAFRLPSGRRVVFHLDQRKPRAVDENHDSASGRFVLSREEPICIVGEELAIAFELAATDDRRKQPAIHADLCRTICAKVDRAWRDELSAPQAAADGRWRLEYHLERFTSWPADDLLIPRDLRPPLEADLARLVAEQLWSPAEIASLEVAELEIRRRQAALVWDFGQRMIAWLDRRAEVWRGLWRRIPSVARTDYLCTLDRVPEPLFDRLLNCEAQWSRWEAWFGMSAKGRDNRRQSLHGNAHLPVDTSLFPPPFAAELLAAPANAGRAADGVLVHGENAAALRLLAGRYAGQVTLCAIDPPYNTGMGVWSYSDARSHAAWTAMMEDRLLLARELLADRGSLFVMLDDHEQARLRLLLDRIFGEQNFLATIIWEKVHTRKNSARHFSVSHDYIHAYARDKRQWQRQLLPRSDSSAYANADGDPRGPWKPDPVYANKPYAARYQIAKPNGVLLDPPPGRYWRYSQQALLDKAARDEVVWGEGAAYPLVKRYLAEAQPGLVPVTLFDRQFAGDNAGSNSELRAFFGRTPAATYPKPSRLIYRLAQIATTPAADEIVLDFFAGTGSAAHGVLSLNRDDGGKRRYVLVEKDDCFDTVLVPRVAKAIYSDCWKQGRPIGMGVSQLVEILRLKPLEAAICRE